MFGSMSLKVKLFVSFAVVCILFSAGLACGLYTVGKLQRLQDEGAKRFVDSRTVSDADLFVEAVYADIADAVINRDMVASKKRLEEIRKEMERHLADVGKAVDTPEEKQWAAELDKAFHAYVDYYEKEEFPVLQRNDPADAKRISEMDSKIDGLREATQAPLQKIDKSLLADSKNADMVFDAEAQWSFRLLTIIGLVAIGAGGLIAFLLSTSIAGSLTRVVDSLSEGSEQVTSASTQLSATAQGMAEGSSEQAASLEETSSAMEEMSAMTRQNADNAGQAKSLAGQAGTSVDKANSSMEQMVRKMSEISSQGEATGKIIKTIDEIAFQTNLLALNAAVEAARAGEAGAGFAVVADEVRNLAQRAAASAKTTSELIEGTIKNINEGMSLVESTNRDFQDVAQAVEKVNELVGEISAASSEQARGITEVSTAISQMDKVTQTNAAGSEEIAASSEELSSQAVSLTEIVGTLQGIITGESAGGRTVAASQAVARHPSAASPSRQLLSRSQGSGRVVGRMTLKKATRQSSAAEEAIPFDDMGAF